MATKLFLLLIAIALLCAWALWSAEPTTTKPAAAAYNFAPIFNDVEIGNHHFDRHTRFTGPVAFSDNAVAVVMAEWPDSHHVGIKGLYTSTSQVIVEEWEEIGGSVIEQLINSAPADVQIDAYGKSVAFRARFSGNGCAGGGTCGGLFLRSGDGARKLIATEVNTVNGSGVYLLLPDGKISVPPGMWAVPTVTATSASGADGKKKAGVLGTILKHVAASIGGIIRGPGGMWITLSGNTAPNSTNEGQQTGMRQGQGSAHIPASWKPEPMPAQPNCAAPPGFPFPWDDLGSAAGPIVFVRADSGGFPAARYVPAGRRPAQGGWGRRTYYTSGCLPVAIALFDTSGKGTLEIHTPIGGPVLFLDQDKGTYRLNGVEDVEPPPPGTPIDSLMRISKRGCEILLGPVSYARGGKAVLRGTPLNKSNCPITE